MKRIFDIIAAIMGLVIFAPLFMVIALFIRLKMGSPVFFRQIRPGKDGKPFEMVKFRSMLNSFDKNGDLLPANQRMTSLGRFLRLTSLDELPELWNVLKGDMSVVGPRPLLMKYLGRYNRFQRRRHEVRPGITGWAQVNGRNAITWEKRFELDVWYVENRSFKLDIKIIFMTIKKVLSREGINAEDAVTMQEFNPLSNKML